MQPLYISIPAWGRAYVDIATRYTIPAVFASLAAAGITDPVNFILHTDEPDKFKTALNGHNLIFRPLANPKPTRETNWPVFKAAHRDAIAITPKGAILTLLNSDIVVSRETFGFVRDTFADEKIKVIASSGGIRATLDSVNAPPIGANAESLNAWIWAHKHSITRECVWGKGRSGLPTVLFFEHEGGVSMHYFHLVPMFMLKDDRDLSFIGTIDDDLLECYGDEEMFVVRDKQTAFAELSPASKVHSVGQLLTVDVMISFWQRRFLPSHLRNFRHRITVIGNPKNTHPAASQIIERLTRMGSVARPVRKQ